MVMDLGCFEKPGPGPKLMTDIQHSTLKTPCIRLGIPEHRMWILPHFKIPHSNTWSWCWSFKCRVLINRHKFRAWTQNLWSILRTLHSGSTLHTQDSPIQIHWVLSVECWVSFISLGPGLKSQLSCLNSLMLYICCQNSQTIIKLVPIKVER